MRSSIILAPISLDLTGLEVLQKLNSIQDNPSPTSSHIDDIIEKVSKGFFSPNTMLKQDEEKMIVESINNFVVEEDVQMEIGKEEEEEEKQQEPQPPVELELTETNNETCSDKFQILLQAKELK
jgi:hypothetical protein